MRFARSILAGCFLVLSAAAGALSIEIAPNGSFESDRNRDGSPDGWIPVLFDSPATAEWDRKQAHAGTASVRLANSEHPANREWRANTARWVLKSRASVGAKQTVTARGWIRTRLTRGEAKIVLAWFAGSRWLHEDSSPPVSGQTEWTERAVTARAPERADGVSVYLMLNSGKGSAWFDDVRAVRGANPPGNYRPISLKNAVNVGFRDERAGDGRGGWTDQGPNDLRGIPLGRRVFRGVPFVIIDPAENGGKSCIVLTGKGRTNLPTWVTFAMGDTCDVLYFLHACAWAGKPGSPVAEYEIQYLDGNTRRIPIRNGREITDWWDPADTDGSALGWTGANAESSRIGLGIFPWKNPRPNIPIASVTAKTPGKGANLMLVAVTAGDGEAAFPELPLDYRFTDTTGWYEWEFPLDNPALGELDLSRFLDAPAGKHGFLRVTAEGRFAFADGTPARFFGTNVGGARCSPEREQAKTLAARLAAYGVNLLRLHAPDGRWGKLIDYEKGNSRSLNPEALDRMDFFVAELKKRGIYVYFDLLDYRKFLPGDEVRDAERMDTRWKHSLKGASIFNRRMIDLQKEFATRLLTHRNPYTGLRYVDEPALVVQEVTNENSLFYLANTRLMLPSYVRELEQRWNRWLLAEFPTRAALRQAWTAPGGECALNAEEDPAKGTVELPLGRLYDPPPPPGADPSRTAVRLNAMTRFLYELQVDYYREMVEHLRNIGLKCPITGTNQDFSDAGNRANAFCDLTTRNNYWCHPNLNAKPFSRFRNLSVLRSAICSTANPVSNVASSTVAGRPIISPEFNFPWPNEFRAECLPLMTAYAGLQEWDGLLFFAYDPRSTRMTYFGNVKDPTRWGQVVAAAVMFHRRDISASPTTVHVGISRVDTFAARPRRVSDTYSHYRVLPYLCKMRNAYFDEVYTGDAHVVISSGHSAHGDYSRARKAIVFADSAATDEAGYRLDRGQSARTALPGLRTRTEGTATTIEEAAVPENAVEIRRAGKRIGLLTHNRYVCPDASMVPPKDRGTWLHRTILRAFQHWRIPGTWRPEEAGKIFRSDTGQLVLDSTARTFTAVAPRARMAVGFLAAETLQLGDVSVTCRTPFASISIVALDDAEQVRSAQKILITAVARAENTGQATIGTDTADQGIDADTGAFLPPGNIAIAEFGRAPVLVEPVDADITIPGTGWKAFPLDPTGRKRDELQTVREGGMNRIPIREAKSPWILLEKTTP